MEKLCRSKEDGGLGFHDIASFNQSLLCKQAWRLVDSPDSLFARLLKSRYFEGEHFLTSTVGNRPSYAWRSILFGRELLLRGLVRSVGDGRETNAYSAHWIFDSVPRSPIPLVSINSPSLRVVDLIDCDTYTWKTEMVRELYVPQDADYILRLRISSDVKDSFYWGFTKDGRYSSQSGYKFLSSESMLSQPVIPPVEKSLWSKIWKIKTSPKIRHFLWKMIHGALPVAERLQTRGVNVPSVCSVCNVGIESIPHTLFTCDNAARVWQLSGIPLPATGFSSNAVFVNIHYLVSLLAKQGPNEEAISLFPWLLWQIWKGRNALVFEKIRWSPEAIFQRAKEEATEWLAANHHDGVVNHVPFVVQRWSPPPMSYVKCNVAEHCNRSLIGAGWILRDFNGTVLAHARSSFLLLQSKLEAQLHCLLWACEDMIALHQHHVIFEICGNLALQAISDPDRFPIHHVLLTRINQCLRRLPSSLVQVSSPETNSIATRVAVSAIQAGRHHSYIQTAVPSWLLPDIVLEAAVL